MSKRRWLNRDIVVGRAVQIADEEGEVTAVSLTALAQSLEVRPPSLYNHVASLEDLQHGMAVSSLRLLLEELRQASRGMVGRAALESIAHAYRQFAQAPSRQLSIDPTCA
ncbi:MAG: hypothetical protein HC804_02890 [Anaerolineae bacterium]|nr:hypothetical protein [Anaerolineae bacterium]